MRIRTTKRLEVSGYCDYLSKKHSILTTYTKLDFLGDENSYAKAISFHCKYGNECGIEDCPLFDIAAQRVYW